MFLTEVQSVLPTMGLSDTQQIEIKEAIENPSIIKDYIEKLIPGAIGFVMQIVVAVIILIVGLKVINWIGKVFKKSLERANIEAGMMGFLCSMVRYILYFVLFMIILSQFGIATGSVVAVLGSAGLTVGLALQGSLANFAGGVLILLLKPFVIGDYIVAGVEGTVEEISIFYTKLVTGDNNTILVPNGTLSNSTITNVSHVQTRRVEVKVGISYNANIAEAKKVLMDVLENDEAVLKDQPMQVFVSDLGDSSVNMEIRAWVMNDEYWPSKWRLTEEVKNALDAHNIEIPFPQLDVHQK